MTLRRFNPTQRLILRQVDHKLEPWRKLPRQPPPGGWLRVVREALGMSTVQMAHRLGISRQAMAALEQRERQGAVTLAALSKAADALDCDLVYALVPRSELKSAVENQARSRAEKELHNAAHTMSLEAQGVPLEETERLIKERTLQLLSTGARRLWDERDTEKGESKALRQKKPRGSTKR